MSSSPVGGLGETSQSPCSYSHVLLGFCGKRVQLLQWMISLMMGCSGGAGGGGTRVIPAIRGFRGVMMPKLGSKLWTQMESENHKDRLKLLLLIHKPQKAT